MNSPVESKKVQGRRPVHYKSYQDLLDDITRVSKNHVALGNWSLAQIVDHLAKAYRLQVEPTSFKPPWIIGFIARTFMKRAMLTKPLPSGFKIPNKHRETFEPKDSTSLSDAVRALEDAIELCKSSTTVQRHPILGKLSRDEWQAFNLRHAEMHMSFVVAGKSDE